MQCLLPRFERNPLLATWNSNRSEAWPALHTPWTTASCQLSDVMLGETEKGALIWCCKKKLSFATGLRVARPCWHKNWRIARAPHVVERANGALRVLDVWCEGWRSGKFVKGCSSQSVQSNAHCEDESKSTPELQPVALQVQQVDVSL